MGVERNLKFFWSSVKMKTTQQKLCDKLKEVLMEEFITLRAYIKSQNQRSGSPAGLTSMAPTDIAVKVWEQ